MTPPINIDGNDVTGVTINGQDVSQITVDGNNVIDTSFDIRFARNGQRVRDRFNANDWEFVDNGNRWVQVAEGETDIFTLDNRYDLSNDDQTGSFIGRELESAVMSPDGRHIVAVEGGYMYHESLDPPYNFSGGGKNIDEDEKIRLYRTNGEVHGSYGMDYENNDEDFHVIDYYGEITRYNSSDNYDASYASPSDDYSLPGNDVTNIRSIDFNHDGTRAWAAGGSFGDQTIRQIDFDTPYDWDTATLDFETDFGLGVKSFGGGVEWNDDGSKLFIAITSPSFSPNDLDGIWEFDV